MYDIHYTGCLAECKKIEHCLLSILHFLSLCPTMSPDQHTASNPLLRLALSLTVQSMQCVGIFHEYQKEFYQPLLSTLKDGRLVGKLSLEASYALEAISHCNLTPHTPHPPPPSRGMIELIDIEPHNALHIASITALQLNVSQALAQNFPTSRRLSLGCMDHSGC